MKVRNNTGPSTVPCGMPYFGDCHDDLNPLTQTRCLRFVRKLLSQESEERENPSADNLLIRPGMPTRSYALLRSRKTACTSSPLSIAICHFCTRKQSCVTVEWLGRNPNSGIEKSAAIRPFATEKSRLASEKILLADSLATESCRSVDRLATKLFSKRTTPMRTERDRARSVADGCLSVQDARELAVRASSIVFASKSTPRVYVPSLRFFFRNNLSFVGRRKYRTRCDCQFARHISLHMSPFQFGFEPSKCPGASTDTSVRSKKKKKQRNINSKKKVRRIGDGEKAPAAKRRKVPKSQYRYIVLPLTRG